MDSDSQALVSLLSDTAPDFPVLLSDVADYVHSLLRRKGAKERFTDQVVRWHAERQSGSFGRGISPDSPRTLPEQYAVLAAIHDSVYSSSQINPWPEPNEEEPAAAWSYPLINEAIPYRVLVSEVSALGKRKQDKGLLQDALADVTADVDERLLVSSALPIPTIPPPQDAIGEDEPDRYEVLSKLNATPRKAYLSFLWAEAKKEKRLQDREAYDLLAEDGIDVDEPNELHDYELPAFDT